MCESLFEVVDKVVGILQPDGDAQHGRRDACCGEVCVAELFVRVDAGCVTTVTESPIMTMCAARLSDSTKRTVLSSVPLSSMVKTADEPNRKYFFAFA